MVQRQLQSFKFPNTNAWITLKYKNNAIDQLHYVATSSTEKVKILNFLAPIFFSHLVELMPDDREQGDGFTSADHEYVHEIWNASYATSKAVPDTAKDEPYSSSHNHYRFVGDVTESKARRVLQVIEKYRATSG